MAQTESGLFSGKPLTKGLGATVFRASAVLTVGKFTMRSLDMIATLVIANFLTPQDFGMVALATASLLILRAVTELPIAESLIRNEKLTKALVDSAFSLSVLRGVLVALLMTAVAYPMGIHFEDPRLLPLMAALSTAPLLASLRSPLMITFAKEMNYVPGMLLDLSSKFLGFIAATAVAWVNQSYWALIIVFIVPPLISSPLSFVIAPYRPNFDLSHFRSLISFAGWVSLSRIISTAGMEFDRFLIGSVLGKAQLGYFSVGRSLVTGATWALGAPLMTAAYPGFAKIGSDAERMRRAYLRGQSLLVAVMMPLGLTLALLAEPIILLVLNEQWLPAATVLQVLGIAGALQTITIPVFSVLMALGQPKTMAIRETALFAVSIPAVYYGATHFGLVGAVCARALALVCECIISLFIIRSLLAIPVGRQLLSNWRSFVSAALMPALFYLTIGWTEQTDTFSLLFGVAASAAVGFTGYFVTHVVLWYLAGLPDGPEALLLQVTGLGSRIAYAPPQRILE